MASNADVAASEDASASIAYEDDFMVSEGGHTGGNVHIGSYGVLVPVICDLRVLRSFGQANVGIVSTGEKQTLFYSQRLVHTCVASS